MADPSPDISLEVPKKKKELSRGLSEDGSAPSPVKKGKKKGKNVEGSPAPSEAESDAPAKKGKKGGKKAKA